MNREQIIIQQYLSANFTKEEFACQVVTTEYCPLCGVHFVPDMDDKLCNDCADEYDLCICLDDYKLKSEKYCGYCQELHNEKK